MKIRVLGCFGGDLKGRFPSFLLNGKFLLDAGTIGTALSLPEQQAIEAVLLSHHHFDHILGLPFFADAIYNSNAAPIKIFGLDEVLSHIRNHILNDVIWPDFTRLPNAASPVFQYEPIEMFQEYSLGKSLIFTPIPTYHQGPSCGFFIREGDDCIVYSGDTGPSEDFWRSIVRLVEARKAFRLRAVIIECSYPDTMEEFALKTRHLTPGMLEEGLRLLKHLEPEILVFHMKPQYIQRIEEEIRQIDGYRIQLTAPDQEVLWDG